MTTTWTEVSKSAGVAEVDFLFSDGSDFLFSDGTDYVFREGSGSTAWSNTTKNTASWSESTKN